MTPPNEDIIRKIVSLLKLADPNSGATANEARVAMRKALELKTKYQIEQAAIDKAHIADAKGSMPTNFNVKHVVVELARKYKNHYDDNVSAILKECFAVDVIWGNGARQGYPWTYIIVGDELDMRIAQSILPVLLDTFHRSILDYFKRAGLKWKCSIARAYADGVTRGYVEGSEEGQSAARAAAKRKDADAFAIVLVDKDNAVCAYVEKTFKIKKCATRNRGWDPECGPAQAAGIADGRNMTLVPKLNA